MIEPEKKGWQTLAELQPGLKDVMRLFPAAAEIGVKSEPHIKKKKNPLLFLPKFLHSHFQFFLTYEQLKKISV